MPMNSFKAKLAADIAQPLRCCVRSATSVRQLDYQRLAEIREATKKTVQLILHEANGFDEASFKMCIECGVANCNIDAALNR